MTSIKIRTLEEVSKSLNNQLDKALEKVDKHSDAIIRSSGRKKLRKKKK